MASSNHNPAGRISWRARRSPTDHSRVWTVVIGFITGVAATLLVLVTVINPSTASGDKADLQRSNAVSDDRADLTHTSPEHATRNRTFDADRHSDTSLPP